ncbi:SMP-30/gluconolactonase/LRE family protein [Roseomonas terrae]|jgi:gluconolactonase|uniref:SMP-30/gluconolactonase/LRE family protein n=1 Tax=Neoroseomonas terrae TaxID=424799 RepID=A0ABS5EFN8_9PROT|nr:SMP-30/gluconolactonase/LRE family protein [Neoroseomonas terrae]MBR0649823.1 SMP-30/gluconolactonase/LRE family protein [Neoroseomonas terrae]
MAATIESPDLRVVTDGLRFPEGPVCMPDGSIALVEIESRRITRVTEKGEKTTIATVTGGPNGLALGPKGMLYLCNNGGFSWHEEPGLLRPGFQSADYSGGRIERIDPASGGVETLVRAIDGRPLRGPNDLMFDAHGGFWFSDLGKVRARDRDHGGAYYAKADGSGAVEAAFPIFGGANGIGISPDGKTVYVAETETGRLWAWDVEAPGKLSKAAWPSTAGGRVICQFPGFRRLDSLAIAASGNIIVATLVAGEITTVSPAGEILRVVKMPERMPTNICFGGADMRTAYITLSTTGKLVAMEWDEPGLRLPHG